MLRVSNLTKTFEKNTACDNIDLSITKGEFFFIIGPSGCGKSTLLKMIAGLVASDSGDIEFEKKLVTKIPAYERPFNIVFQNYSLFPHLSVYDNISFGLKMKRMSKHEIDERVQEVLNLFQISELSKRKPENLSGGQQQRVALARAIVNKPSILLLDEPLSALDEKLRLNMQSTFKDLKSKMDTTFIYVTHNQEEALSMADRIAVMKKGSIEQIGTPQEIYYSPSTKFIAEFLGEINIIKYCTYYKDDFEEEKLSTTNNEEVFNSFNPLKLLKKEVQIVRPENIYLSTHIINGDDYCEIKQGVVIQKMFMGNTMTYIIQCMDSRIFKATNFNTDYKENISISDEVYFGWKKDSIKNVKA